MASKKLLARSNVILTALLVLGILCIINYVSSRDFYARQDLTKGKVYTVSPSTKKVLRGLDDIVNVKCYFTKEIPENYRRNQDQVKDLLDEYRAFAKGNLRIEYINPPVDDQEMENKLRGMGIPKLQLQVLKKDKLETVLAYMGLVVLYEDRKEAMPAVLNTENLEYDLTSAIFRVTNASVPVIGVLGGGAPGEPSAFDEGYRAIKPELEKHYRVRTVNVSGGQPVPSDVKALFVIGGTRYTEREIYEIDQYVMRGGRVIFAIDSMQMQPQVVAQASPLKTGIEPLIQSMGVKLGDDLVLDAAMAQAPFQRQQGPFRMNYLQPYPYWLKVGKPQLAAGNVVLSGLDVLVFPWTRSLEAVKGDADAFEVVPLAHSSDKAWTVSGLYNLSPMQSFEKPKETKTYMLAALVQGKFKSFFADKPVPLPEPPPEGQQPPPPPPEPVTVPESPETKIAVLGTSKLGMDNIISQYNTNAVFFLNLVDDLTIGDALIGIRSRVAATYPLKDDISDATQTIVKFAGILGIPILVIAFSVIRRFYRRRSRAVQELLYR